MDLVINKKEEFITLLDKFDKKAKHLHTGLWTEKVVLIDEHSTFIRLQHSSFAESIPLLNKSKISYPLILTAETPKDFLNLDIKITKSRDGSYVIDFQPTPMRPVKDFLIREYEMHLGKFLDTLTKGIKKK
ncbi:MAG: hypothetical protein QF475_00610 [Candidatus Undinarchaeales archaeon]|jgi:hypothetical protein|nr:hypothetical protein [Candidatus Undinarchaeales archaeon]